jgi:DNA-binding LacI/PurR family transcriptional regulator
MGTRRPTIIDVAARAGVSKSLVSMVLRGDPGPSAASRATVLAAAQEIGYTPNRAAAILAAGRTDTVGVALDDYRNPWYVPLFAGIREAVAGSAVRLASADKTSNAHLDVSPLDDLLSLRVDGVLVAAEIAVGSRGEVVVPDVPVVMVGHRAHVVPGADVVSDDPVLGGRIATQHLVDLGHRSIAHVAGSDRTGRARRAGYEAAMRDAGLRALVIGGDDARVAAGAAPDTTESDGYHQGAAILDAQPDVTAVFAANDSMAMGVMGAAAERGLRVPEDLSVIGYDDSPIAGAALLRLTTIDARWHEVGRIAALQLLERIGGEVARTDPVRETLLAPRLVGRRTTAPPRA